MAQSRKQVESAERFAPIEMTPEEFRRAGHRLVDRIAEFLESIPKRPLTPNEPPHAVRAALGDGPLPSEGARPQDLLDQAATLLFEHSLLSAHPRFWGYIYSSAAPIGALGDFLAAAVNPNVGAWNLSPLASEIEAQTVRWIAELIGYPADCGGLLVSGGNMANFVPFLAARTARPTGTSSGEGLRAPAGRFLRVYCSAETHTWIHKAADLFGLGTDSIRWIGDGRRTPHGHGRITPADPRGQRARRPAVSGGGRGGLGQDRRHRSAAGACGHRARSKGSGSMWTALMEPSPRPCPTPRRTCAG